MEDVLEVSTRPYDPTRPQVCMDEASQQVLKDTRTPIPMTAGQPRRIDHEYERGGVVNVFLFSEPLAGQRWVSVTAHRAKPDWAHAIKALVDDHYPDAERIVLVLDNLNTHSPAALDETFSPTEAKRLTDKLEIHHTPKHGSWLNMAEIELSVLSRQCLNRRVSGVEELTREVAAWEARRNADATPVDWRFTTEDARIKLKRLYPKIDK
jgi:hypothetical protein